MMTEDLYQSFLSFSREHRLLSENETVIAGISGGADSVCLLLLLHRFCCEHNGRLIAVHINHMIRGRDADRDEAFVKALCRELGISCRTEKADVPALSLKQHISEEEAGRTARYRILGAAARKEKGKIAVAHHLNDNAETVLLNLARGTGIKGLTGLKPSSRMEGCEVIRPLLFSDRSRIEKYLAEQDAAFCTDGTNSDPAYARNRIRLRVLPELSKINRQAAAHICRTAEDLGELEEFLEKETERRMSQASVPGSGEVCLSISELRRNEPLFIRRILYRAIVQAAGKEKDVTAEHVRAVEKLLLLQSGRRISLPYRLTAIRQYDEIRLIKNKEERKGPSFPVIRIRKEELLEKERKEALPGGGEVLFRVEEVTDENRKCLTEKNTYTKAFDYDKIVDVIIMGEKVPGDRIFLKNGTKTLKKLFADEKIPSVQRSGLLLFKDGESVIWAVPLRISEKHKITGRTKKALVIRITGGQDGRGN